MNKKSPKMIGDKNKDRSTYFATCCPVMISPTLVPTILFYEYIKIIFHLSSICTFCTYSTHSQKRKSLTVQLSTGSVNGIEIHTKVCNVYDNGLREL